MSWIGIWGALVFATVAVGFVPSVSGWSGLAAQATGGGGPVAPNHATSARSSSIGAFGVVEAVGDGFPVDSVLATDPRRNLGHQAVIGEVVVEFHACPPGVFASEASPERCPASEELGEFQMFVLGSGDNRRTLQDAEIGGSQVVWGNLPPGDYLLNALALPPGYARFYVPGLEGINAPPERGYTASPNEGYLVPIDSGASFHQLDLFLIPEPQPDAPTTDLAVAVFACPPGVEAAPVMDDLGCAPVAPPVGLELTLEGAPLVDLSSAAAATPTANGGWEWPDLLEGDYVLRAELPPDVDGYAVRTSGPLTASVLQGGNGYLIELDPAPEADPATLAVYLLRDGSS